MRHLFEAERPFDAFRPGPPLRSVHEAVLLVSGCPVLNSDHGSRAVVSEVLRLIVLPVCPFFVASRHLAQRAA